MDANFRKPQQCNCSQIQIKWTVRERFDLLLGRCRQQSSEEEKASGASPEPTEFSVLLELISEREIGRINERIF